MTRHSISGVGPCVTSRAHILNRAGATVALDIHADGGPAWGRGFTVLEPVADGPNDGIITASEHLGNDVRSALLKYTTMPVSNYDGHDGLVSRNDLAGLNDIFLVEIGLHLRGADGTVSGDDRLAETKHRRPVQRRRQQRQRQPRRQHHPPHHHALVQQGFLNEGLDFVVEPGMTVID